MAIQELLLQQAECTLPNTNLFNPNIKLEIIKCKACGDDMRSRGTPCSRGLIFRQEYDNMKKKLIEVIKMQQAERAAQPEKDRDEALSRKMKRIAKKTNELMLQYKTNESKLNKLQRKLEGLKKD